MAVHNVRELLIRLRRFFRRHPDGYDPYARVRVPLKKGPGGLSSSVALKEPRE
jgi:hypothetical protein